MLFNQKYHQRALRLMDLERCLNRFVSVHLGFASAHYQVLNSVLFLYLEVLGLALGARDKLVSLDKKLVVTGL